MAHIARISILLMNILLVSGNFGYSKRDQHTWSQKFKSCAGKMQSPISISSSKAISLHLPALEIVGYHNPLPSPLILKNNGHTVAVGIGNSTTVDLPYIFGAAFKRSEVYEFDHVHFHWGGKNNKGSEHILNGIRFPIEMHIVHRRKGSSTLSDALNFKDGVAVLGIFFQLQEEDNRLFSSILNNLIKVQWLNSKIALNSSITLASLMPHNTEIFYTYKGSLTTPPCNEVVTWIIFPTPVSISFKQINKFRGLFNGDEILADNYRHLQNIGHRKVFVRRLYPSLITNDTTNFNVTNLSWFWY